MKRFVLAILLLSFAFSLNAQSIKYRRLLDPEGLSVMTTNLEVFPWGEKKIEYALQYEIAPIEEMHQGYYLNVYFSSHDKDLFVPAQGKLLIRTTKNNIISLTDSGESSFREFNPEFNLESTSYRSTSYFDDVLKRVMYTVHAKYPISEEDLKLLKDEGVIKIRIETTGAAVECNYKDDGKKNKTADVITRLYNRLVKEIDIYNEL